VNTGVAAEATRVDEDRAFYKREDFDGAPVRGFDASGARRSLGRKLLNAVLGSGVTQREIAQRANVSRSEIGHLSIGKTPGLRTAVALERALNIACASWLQDE
jgi:DNA-binding XRE family transcriptional regulator